MSQMTTTIQTPPRTVTTQNYPITLEWLIVQLLPHQPLNTMNA